MHSPVRGKGYSMKTYILYVIAYLFSPITIAVHIWDYKECYQSKVVIAVSLLFSPALVVTSIYNKLTGWVPTENDVLLELFAVAVTISYWLGWWLIIRTIHSSTVIPPM
jgi:hypothetical protein